MLGFRVLGVLLFRGLGFLGFGVQRFRVDGIACCNAFRVLFVFRICGLLSARGGCTCLACSLPF